MRSLCRAVRGRRGRRPYRKRYLRRPALYPLASLLLGIRLGALTGGRASAGELLGFAALLLALGVGAVLAVRARRQGVPWAGPGPGRPRLLAALLVAGVLGGHVLVTDLPARRRPSVVGAAGYVTFRGPLGKPMPQGRPWGRPCQPVRFTVEEHVPDEAYAQVAAVVAEARRDGLDVTMEDRSFRWRPQSLYYPEGMTSRDARRVAVFADDRRPPRLRNGHQERVRLGWDAVREPDGRHEHLTAVQGHLRLAALTGQPVAERTAVRQLVALTQGVFASNRRDSGITSGTGHDGFSRGDVTAMRRMSGCGDAALATVSAAG